jgi:N-acetylmuramoyl-L-alanine amidase
MKHGEAMKKIFICVLWIILAVFSFAGTISSVKANKSSISINFENSNAPAPRVEYDKFTRQLCLTFAKTDLGSKIDANKLKNKYFEDIDIIKKGTSVIIFITLEKDVTYSGSAKGKAYSLLLNSGKKQYTIAIDAGHGGKDPGAKSVSQTYQEKDIALAVAKYLRNELQTDFKIIMTRDTDVFIPLSERPAMANRVKTDFFISVHINASRNHSASGSEVYYFSTEKPSAYAAKIAAYENSSSEYGGEPADSIKQLAGSVAYNTNRMTSEQFANSTVVPIAKTLRLDNKGVHGANFAVLRGFNGPGVLLELGFISNTNDLKILLNDKNQRAVAKAIAAQVREYFK